jgi:hypothetical protein
MKNTKTKKILTKKFVMPLLLFFLTRDELLFLTIFDVRCWEENSNP